MCSIINHFGESSPSGLGSSVSETVDKEWLALQMAMEHPTFNRFFVKISSDHKGLLATVEYIWFFYKTIMNQQHYYGFTHWIKLFQIKMFVSRLLEGPGLSGCR